jgi:hypothetical protein
MLTRRAALIHALQQLRRPDLERPCNRREAPERRIRPAAIDKNGSHVSLLERGRINITVNTARQIAHVLESSLSELFRGMG